MTGPTETTIAPVVRTVDVKASPAAAFDHFTARMADWWPGEKNSVSAGQGATPKQLVFEAREGGAVYEILPDGSRTDWGVVTLWQPGAAYEMTWHPGHPPENATHLRVEFTAEGAGCRVRLTHSGWEALGEKGAAMREGYNGGWVGVLDRFASVAGG